MAEDKEGGSSSLTMDNLKYINTLSPNAISHLDIQHSLGDMKLNMGRLNKLGEEEEILIFDLQNTISEQDGKCEILSSLTLDSRLRIDGATDLEMPKLCVGDEGTDLGADVQVISNSGTLAEMEGQVIQEEGDLGDGDPKLRADVQMESLVMQDAGDMSYYVCDEPTTLDLEVNLPPKLSDMVMDMETLHNLSELNIIDPSLTTMMDDEATVDKEMIKKQTSKENMWKNIKVKRSGDVKMMVVKAEHAHQHSSQSQVMADVIGSVRAKITGRKQQIKNAANIVTLKDDQSDEKATLHYEPKMQDAKTKGVPSEEAIKMTGIAKMHLVNLEFSLESSKNDVPRRLPYLYMRVSEGFDDIDEEAKSTIVGIIHNLVSHGKTSSADDQCIKKEPAYTCTQCGKGFQLWKDWKMHIKSHLVGPTNECGICKKIFKNENSLRYHKRRHMGQGITKTHSCEVCGKAFYSRAAAMEHSRVHTGERPFECPVCNRKFLRKFTLKQHQVVHTDHPPRPYRCSLCGDTFRRKRCLDDRGRCKKHWEDRKFTCRQCGATFSSLGEVLFHRKMHRARGSKMERVSHHCALCGHVFPSSLALKKHTAVHLGQMPHTCLVCDRGFVTRRAANYHIKKGKCKPTQTHPCRFCGSDFQSRGEAEQHEMSHAGTDLYHCEVCGQTFQCSSEAAQLHVDMHGRELVNAMVHQHV